MKAFTFIMNAVFLTLMLAVAGLFLLPLLPLEGNLELRIVESGSMEPAIMTGALVGLRPAPSYQLGDVITFEDDTAQVPTTHRIVEIYEESGQTVFTTKGDANEEADTAAVYPDSILGKVYFDVPYAGFVLDFARQPVGFALLVVLPAIMIILGEVEKIWREVRKGKSGRREDSVAVAAEVETTAAPAPVVSEQPLTTKHTRMMDIATPARYKDWPTLDLRQPANVPAVSARRQNSAYDWGVAAAIVLSSTVFAAASFVPSTVSYFRDAEGSLANVLQGVILDFTVAPDGATYTFTGTELNENNGTLLTVVEPADESAEVRYDVRVEFIAGIQSFCDAIIVDANPTIAYNGPLTGLLANDVDFNGAWTLDLELNENGVYAEGDTCRVDIVYQAWHAEEEADMGYNDEERVPLMFTAPAAPALFAPASFQSFVAEEEVPTLPTEPVVDEPAGTEEPKPTPELPVDPEPLPTEPELTPDPIEEPVVEEPEAEVEEVEEPEAPVEPTDPA